MARYSDVPVFVVDDDDAARNSLVFLLRAERITARGFPSATDFLAQVSADHHGCVVTDVRMPDIDGIALTTRLKVEAPQMPVVVVTGHGDIPTAVKAMQAGAIDFIEKPYDGDQLLEIVRRCLERARSEGHRAESRSVWTSRMGTLTSRERAVCEHVVQGLSNKEIAQALDISPRTVEIHRAHVMEKMKAGSLSALVRMMVDAGRAWD